MIAIASSRKEMPIRAVIYGRDGVGKSTFCADAPNAVFVAVESGIHHLDAMSVSTPETWEQLCEYVQELGTDNRCGTIVIDSIDWAEVLCWKHVCQKGRMPDIESFGFGKGYVSALAQWCVLLGALEVASRNGKGVLLIGHAERKSVRNPTGEDYESWQIKLNAKAAGKIREWADVVGFAELDIAVIDGKTKTDRAKGFSTGRRVLRTQPSAGYDAKTRYVLPETMPLDWFTFARAIKAGRPPTVAQLQATLAALLYELASKDIANGCSAFLEKNGSTFAALSEAVETVKYHLSQSKSDTEADTKEEQK